MKHEHRFLPVSGVNRTIFASYITWYCDCGDFKHVPLKDNLTEPEFKQKLEEAFRKALTLEMEGFQV